MVLKFSSRRKTMVFIHRLQFRRSTPLLLTETDKHDIFLVLTQENDILFAEIYIQFENTFKPWWEVFASQNSLPKR